MLALDSPRANRGGLLPLANPHLRGEGFDLTRAAGSLIVHEHLIDDDRRKNIAGLLMSLMMLIETQDGFDYTEADCCAWMREVGLRGLTSSS